MSRSKRSALNFASSLTLMASTVAIGFVSTPLLIKWLGEELYGAFRTTVDCYGYLSLLELGLDSALLAVLSRVLNAAHGSPEEAQAELRQVVMIGLRTYAYLTAIYMLVGAVLVFFIQLLVPVKAAYLSDLHWGAAVATVSFALLPLTTFRAFAEAAHRGYHVNTLLFFQSLLVTAGALLAAYCGWGLTGQFVALLIGSAFFHGALGYTALGRLRAGALKAPPPAGRSLLSGELWRLNRVNFMMNVCGKLGLMSDQIIISSMLGPAATVPFFLTCRLPQIAQKVLQNVGNSSWPALVELHAKGQGERFNERLVELTRLVAVLAIAGLVPIVCANHHFVALWMGDDHFAGQATSVCAAVTTFILALVSLWGWCFTATGKPDAMLPVIAVQTALNLGLSIWFTSLFGIRGPLLGTAVAQVLTVLWYLPLKLRATFGTSPRLVAKAIALPLLAACPYGLLVYRAFSALAPFNWFSLAAAMAVSGCLFMLFAGLVLISNQQRQVWRSRLLDTLARRSRP